MSPLPWTGERFLPGEGGPEIAYEHFSRYLLAANLSAGRTVLDVGSGEGYGAFLLARMARHVLGIDLSKDAVQHAGERYRRKNLEFRSSGIGDLIAEYEKSFDLISCFEVIEHVGGEEQHEILSAVERLLSPAGLLLISTPNRPVYRDSGGPGYRNPFHVREMDFVEFRDLLAGYFDSVAWYLQGPLSGNLLRRLQLEGEKADTESFRVEAARPAAGGLLPDWGPVLEDAKYFMAVCSKSHAPAESPNLPGGFVFVDAGAALDRERSEMARWAMGLAPKLEEREKELRQAQAVLRKESQRWESDRARWESVRKDLESRLEAACETMEQEQNAARASSERAERLQQETARLRDELARVHQLKLWKLASFYWRLRYPHKPVGEELPGQDVPLGPETAPGEAGVQNAEKPQLLPVSGAEAQNPEERQETPQTERLINRPLRSLAARCRAAGRPDPTFLDWDSGLDVAGILPGEVVFSPFANQDALPYEDGSVDAIVLREGNGMRLAEAKRIAAVAVVTVSESDLCVDWVEEAGPLATPSVSIIIPVFNHASVTEVCLNALKETLPGDWAVDVVVVDDASTDTTPQMLRAFSSQVSWLRVLRNEVNSGFVDSINRGAREARGELLVFLNNDTIPHPGWLESLAGTFVAHSDAGAAGGKLIWPDGKLQEAGCAIFSDGSGFNVGRHEPGPEAPAFSFLREVDYCSGALLATPRRLFEEIGGLDTRYRPAYYEDTDYCFAVRAKGKKVYYQPDSAVIHLEGQTAGTSTSQGVKSYQVVNREKFREKWREELALHPEPPEDASYRTMHGLVAPRGAKRALVMSHTLPEFDLEGGSRRIFHLVRFLREAGWMVSFLAPWVPHGERYERVLRQMGVATYRKGLRKLSGGVFETEADRLFATGNLDLALIAFWHIAEEWAPRVRQLSPETRIIVDSVDLHFLRNSRRAFLPSVSASERGLPSQYGDEMRREMNQYDAADAVLTVSQKEADTVNDFLGRETAFAVPDCEDVPEGSVPFTSRRGSVFLGSLRHPPNIEAVHWLLEAVWPELDPALLEKHPIRIVGTGLDEKFARLAGGRPGVKMVGWVPSVTPYLQKARVSAVPLLHGAGTKRKLVQAALSGTPSVSTPIGAEGLGLTNGENVLVASDPKVFAHEMTRLLTDEELWTRLSRAAKKELAQRHDPEHSSRRLIEVVDRVVRSRT